VDKQTNWMKGGETYRSFAFQEDLEIFRKAATTT